jgi:hypothetical protein
MSVCARGSVGRASLTHIPACGNLKNKNANQKAGWNVAYRALNKIGQFLKIEKFIGKGKPAVLPKPSDVRPLLT